MVLDKVNLMYKVVKANLPIMSIDLSTLYQVAYRLAYSMGLTPVYGISTNSSHFMILQLDGYYLTELVKKAEHDVYTHQQLRQYLPSFGKGMLIISQPEKHPQHHLLCELIEKKRICRCGIQLSKDITIALHVQNPNKLHPIIRNKVVRI